LAADEIDQFLNASKTDEHCGGVKILIDEIDSGNMQLWVWRDDSSVCIFITEVTVQRDGKRELLMRMLAGDDMISKYKEAADDICIEARNLGCESLIAYVQPHILEKLVEADRKKNSVFDFQEIYRVISREV
tara:strand:- start:1018 stop:1413 length:396 start_codon:yes stop_codon:yes gene_type:complete